MNDIQQAIQEGHAHNLAIALQQAGVKASAKGNRGADDSYCDVVGYGHIWYDTQEPGWVCRAYADGCDYPIEEEDILDLIEG